MSNPYEIIKASIQGGHLRNGSYGVTINEALRPDVDPNWPFNEKMLLRKLVDDALKLNPRTDAPMAWTIERDGRVTMVHYEACAKRAEENGYTVTPYHSRVTK